MQDGSGAVGQRRQGSSLDSGTAIANVLAEAMSALARELDLQNSADEVLIALLASAVALVPGADEASISVVSHRARIRSDVATGELARQIDALQEEVGQGPCLDAIFEQRTVRVDDLVRERRWPLFAVRAARAGAASLLSLQLFAENDNLGALNMVSRTPNAFSHASEQAGLLVAAHAAIAYAGARREGQLTEALISRDVIGQAKGMLMERFGLSGERAFLLLARISQNTNLKLYDVARELVTSGGIAGPHGLPSTRP